MAELPELADLEALRAFDTPTICNALEVVTPNRRALGFNRRPLIAPFPAMKPVVAFARTATIRSREPHPRGAREAGKITFTYYEHIAAAPMPSIAVIQDLDGPDIGLGALWGEVNSHIHKGLGCVGVVTDGSVRDLDVWAADFFVLAGSIMPSHANVHVVDVGTVVNVAGMVVSPNDVIHADRHASGAARKGDRRGKQKARLFDRASAQGVRRNRRDPLSQWGPRAVAVRGKVKCSFANSIGASAKPILRSVSEPARLPLSIRCATRSSATLRSSHITDGVSI
jgi:regulator of RNase E activity RraA